MNNKTNNAVLEEQFIKECRPVFMKKIYPEDTSGIKFIVTSDLAEEILEGIYAAVLDKYRPFVIISSEVRLVLDNSKREEWSDEFDRRQHIADVEFENLDTLQSNEYNPETVALIKERNDKLNRALATLPEKCRRRIEMYFFDGMSYIKIAKAEHTAVSAVHKSVCTGLEILRKMYVKG